MQAPYPAHLKLAPEWVGAVQSMGLPDIAARIQAAMQHPSVVPHARRAAAPTTTGLEDAPTDSEASDLQCRDGADSSFQPSYLPRLYQRSRSNITSHAASDQDEAESLDPDWLLIDVGFPEFMTPDMERLGLRRAAAWSDPLQHCVNPHSEVRAAAESAAAASDNIQAEGSSRRHGECWRDRSGRLTGGACGVHYGNGTLVPGVAAALEWHAPLQSQAPNCGVDVVLEHGSLMFATCPQV